MCSNICSFVQKPTNAPSKHPTFEPTNQSTTGQPTKYPTPQPTQPVMPARTPKDPTLTPNTLLPTMNPSTSEATPPTAILSTSSPIADGYYYSYSSTEPTDVSMTIALKLSIKNSTCGFCLAKLMVLLAVLLPLTNVFYYLFLRSETNKCTLQTPHFRANKSIHNWSAN